MANQAAATSGTSSPATDGVLASVLVFLGETWTLISGAVGFILRGRISARNIVGQMAAIGVGSLPIVLTICFSTGAVFAYYTSSIFVTFGAKDFVGGTLTYGFLNELGPVLTGVAVAARSGAAIAAEIGSMVVTEQVDALRSMAVSPVRYLVVPRLIACVIMLPIACVFGDLAGVAGGYFMSGANGVPHQSFLESARRFANDADLIHGLIKTLWFGLIIAAVACRQGLRTKGGATGVGRSTTSSVVLCVVLIFVSDFFLAQMLTGGKVGR